MNELKIYLYILSAIIAFGFVLGDFVKAETHETKFQIDGKVKAVGEVDGDENWIQDVRIVVDDGQHIGIPK